MQGCSLTALTCVILALSLYGRLVAGGPADRELNVVAMVTGGSSRPGGIQPTRWNPDKFLRQLDDSDTPVDLVPQIPTSIYLRNPISPRTGLGAPFEPQCDLSKYLPCQAPPPPLLSVDTRTPYIKGDKTRSILNVTAKARNMEIVADLDKFLIGVGEMASLYWSCRQRGLNAELAQCAMSWIASWARASAIGTGDDENSDHGNKMLTFYASGITISYLRIRDDPSLNVYEKAMVDDWLNEMALIIMESQGRAVNNIRYWAGLATMTIGIATQNMHYMRFGVTGYLLFLKNVREDGLLSTELFRQHMATHYHAFAVRPLVFMAWFSKNTIGLDLARLRGCAVCRLMENVARMSFDKDYIRTLAPALPPQEETSDPDFGAKQAADAAEVFNRWHYNPDVTRFLRERRPVVLDRLGGLITMTWGVNLRS